MSVNEIRCTVCHDGPFRDQMDYILHCNDRHAKYKCGFCEEEGEYIVPKFSGWSRLRQHMRINHGDKRDHVSKWEKDRWTLSADDVLREDRARERRQEEARVNEARRQAIQAGIDVAVQRLMCSNVSLLTEGTMGIRQAVEIGLNAAFGNVSRSTLIEDGDNDEDIVYRRSAVNYAERARARNRQHPRVTFGNLDPNLSRDAGEFKSI